LDLDVRVLSESGVVLAVAFFENNLLCDEVFLDVSWDFLIDVFGLEYF